MINYQHLLIKKFFDKNNFVLSDIESFNYFIDHEMQKIVDENKDVEPTIIPPEVESFKIRLDNIWITKPEITEADGSKRAIYPIEARLRNLSYSSPIFMEISSHINDVQRESFTTQIGNMPIMLHSKYCHLNKLNKEQLIEKGEDPYDQGGYFIINGTERVLVKIEDLASNSILVERTSTGPSKYVGKMFSEQGPFKIPHTFERLKDGIFYLSFTRVKRVPIILVLKALGLLKDEEIMQVISKEKQYDEVLINLFEFVGIKNADDAQDFLARKIGITQTREIRLQRMQELLDKFLLPHVGTTREDRIFKAYNICKLLKKYIAVSQGESRVDDKDHYMNKRIKMSGDLLGDLFRMNLKVLIGDLLYNFQRIVKRGKFPSIRVIIRDKLLTSRIYSSMATGNWVGGRKGISQRIQRHNYLDTLSHLQRVASPLSNTQENFGARELHPTHLGRLCPSETPEGTNIGLKKNFALLTSVTSEIPEQEVLKLLTSSGLKSIR
ncbi:DNA-directed RNA polymerase subunit B'' [Candidatus Woesearchaeota archaeon]|nr:DNA-directed RNA polymerase subunit B'' [Candidatus Woesearchaeota archaeon]